jgi:hypothetical protein
MPAIIEFPTLVQHAVAQFGAVFANAPERRHFAEYLTGLLVAEKKTVSGINAEFAQTTDQSCLNRWITEVDWDAAQLNQQRLAWLQRDPQTRYAPSGVIPIDNTLVDHSGKLIEDVGYFWDHAEQRHKIAHDYLIANYVCPSGKHYALEFRRFRKRADCEAQQAHLAAQPGGVAAAPEEDQRLAPFKSHTVCAASWSIGWSSGRFPAPSPSIVTLLMPRLQSYCPAPAGLCGRSEVQPQSLVSRGRTAGGGNGRADSG